MKQRIIKIACIGDSITKGYGLANPDKESYPAQLQMLLGNNYEVKNYGVTGTTLLRDTLSPYSITKACEDALDYCADIAIIELGANDIIPSYIDQHQHAFVDDYTVLLEGLRSSNPEMKIYLCSLTPIMGVSGLSDDYLKQWFEFIQLKIREVGSIHGLTVIDITQPLIEAWLEDYKLMPDGVHPGQVGAGIITLQVTLSILSIKK